MNNNGLHPQQTGFAQVLVLGFIAGIAAVFFIAKTQFTDDYRKPLNILNPNCPTQCNVFSPPACLEGYEIAPNPEGKDECGCDRHPVCKFTGEKLQLCPDVWIDNQEPMLVGEPGPAREYYILNDQRREIEEFDTDWVSQNCSLEKEIVY